MRVPIVGTIRNGRKCLEELPNKVYAYEGRRQPVRRCRVKCLICGDEQNISWVTARRKGCFKCRMKLNRKSSEDLTASYCYNAWKSNAATRGYVWNLSHAEVKDIASSPCHYCGVLGGNRTKRDKRILSYNGPDRVDNSVGYVRGNVVACCGTCNIAKGQMTVEEFATWIFRVATHLDPKNKPGTIDAEDVY